MHRVDRDVMSKDTIYLCNFRVSVDGDWLCLKELADVQLDFSSSMYASQISEDGTITFTSPNSVLNI